MAQQRHRRLMQEALDEHLSPEARQELYEQLDQDTDAAAEYQRLRQVDRLLRLAPFERAPKTLALNIMARLAEGLKQSELSRLSGLALVAALVLITALIVPILVGLSALFLAAVGSAAALAALIQAAVALLSVVAVALAAVAQGAQSVLATYPQTPALMLALVPVGAALVRRARRTAPPTDSTDALSS